jgi:hypothetical protein
MVTIAEALKAFIPGYRIQDHSEEAHYLFGYLPFQAII